MVLTLEIIGEQADSLGAAARKVFQGIGGTIGRLPDNDWVIPDPYISGRHALIRYLAGRYFIEDTSTNGVFINSPNSRISRDQPQPLSDGDVLYLDVYQIRVSISRSEAARQDPLAHLHKLSGGAGRTALQQEIAARLAKPDPDEHHTQWLDLRGSGPLAQALRESSSGAAEAPSAVRRAATPAAPAAPAEPPRKAAEPGRDAALAALREAFETMFSEFDPRRLQEAFDREIAPGSAVKSDKGVALGDVAQSRYWALYRDKYRAWAQDPESAFQKLLEERFVEVYDELAGRQKSTRE